MGLKPLSTPVQGIQGSPGVQQLFPGHCWEATLLGIQRIGELNVEAPVRPLKITSGQAANPMTWSKQSQVSNHMKTDHQPKLLFNSAHLNQAHPCAVSASALSGFHVVFPALGPRHSAPFSPLLPLHCLYPVTPKVFRHFLSWLLEWLFRKSFKYP